MQSNSFKVFFETMILEQLLKEKTSLLKRAIITKQMGRAISEKHLPNSELKNITN